MVGIPGVDLPDLPGIGDDLIKDPIGTVKNVVTSPFRFASGVQQMIGAPSGNDGGSSNWAAWGHQDMVDMLDSSVSGEQVASWEQDWKTTSEGVSEVFTTMIDKLRTTLGEGWGGESGARALGALVPIGQWVPMLTQETGRAIQMLNMSGQSAQNAQRSIPRPTGFDLQAAMKVGMDTFMNPGGMPAAMADQIDQALQAQQAAQQFMTSAYSAPINSNDPQVPREYPKLPDPTMAPPDPSLTGGGGVGAGGGGGGGGMPGGMGAMPGGMPVATSAQGFTPSTYEPPAGAPVSPAAASGGMPEQAGTRGGVPVSPAAFAPGGGGTAGGGGAGGGRGGGGGGGRMPKGFGGGAGAGGAGRPGGPPSGPGGVAGAGGAAARGGPGATGRGGMPMGGMGGGGRGSGDDDLEHRNRYLVEEDDDEVNPIIGKLPPALPAGGVIGRAPWMDDQK